MNAKNGEIVSLHGEHFVFLAILSLALATGYSLGRIVERRESEQAAKPAVVPIPAPYTPSGCLWLNDKASP